MRSLEPVCTEDFDYHNHTILVVDSSTDNLYVSVSYLAECGFQVLSAKNGENAFSLANTEQPDLILIDVMLSGMDGFETCERLKAEPMTRNIPVIFMTGLAETDSKLKGFSLGAVDYLTKPFAQEELLARVTTQLKLKDLAENLEKKVRDQTQELVLANKKLEHKISEANRIASALRESEQRYKAVIENSNDGIVIIEAGKIVFLNEKVLHMFEYEHPESLLGRPVEDLFHPREKDRIRQYNRRRETGRPVPEQYEARGVTQSGHRIYIGVSATRITFQDRVAVLGFLKDLTRHKRLEGQLQQAQKMEAIGTLAGGIAHDFNNILNIIIGHTELALLDNTVQTGTQEYLHRVMDASQRASDLVHQILTFSRQKGMESKPLNISVLLKETLKMLRASLPSSIDIQQNIMDSQSLILADSTRIHQLFMNLCTNASHAVPDQGGRIDVELDRLELGMGNDLNLAPGPYLKLSVSDNGHGMDAATKHRIFDPYFTTKKPGEGTGLGLALVHSIVTGYKGFIRVESRPDEGARFDVFLPAVSGTVVQKENELGLEELPRGSEHILFVDDEEMVVTLYEDMMTFLGYSITATSSSLDAWQMFEADPERFDLVITDLTMPRLAGDELAKKMIHLRPDVPIILCTGHSNRVTRRDAQSIGIRQYLMKPIILDQLAFAIRDALGAQRF